MTRTGLEDRGIAPLSIYKKHKKSQNSTTGGPIWIIFGTEVMCGHTPTRPEAEMEPGRQVVTQWPNRKSDPNWPGPKLKFFYGKLYQAWPGDPATRSQKWPKLIRWPGSISDQKVSAVWLDPLARNLIFDALKKTRHVTGKISGNLKLSQNQCSMSFNKMIYTLLGLRLKPNAAETKTYSGQLQLDRL